MLVFLIELCSTWVLWYWVFDSAILSTQMKTTVNVWKFSKLSAVVNHVKMWMLALPKTFSLSSPITQRCWQDTSNYKQGQLSLFVNLTLAWEKLWKHLWHHRSVGFGLWGKHNCTYVCELHNKDVNTKVRKHSFMYVAGESFIAMNFICQSI